MSDRGIKPARASVVEGSARDVRAMTRKESPMKTLFLATAAALAFSAAPASAQLLGGGLGGTIGGVGSLGGLGGSLDRAPTGTIDRVREPVTTTTRSTTRADGNARANSNVDRRSGRVAAAGDAGANGSTLDSAAGALGTTGSGTASGSAGGGANADLIGTDDVRNVAGSATNAARGAVGSTGGLATSARDRARNAVGGVANGTGSVAGGGAAGGSASGTTSNGPLALSGSSAADALGSFAVAPGMEVTDLRGRAIGTVRTLVTDARGRVQAVRMEVGRRLATVPAANFSGSGDVLVSAASKGEIKELAEDQPAD
jgi:hypothetical protein